RAAALAAINAVSNASSIYASYMYPESAGPRYIVAMSVNCVTAFIAIVAATVLRFTLVHLNKKLDKGEVVEGAVAEGEAVPGEAAKKGFRFVFEKRTKTHKQSHTKAKMSRETNIATTGRARVRAHVEQQPTEEFGDLLEAHRDLTFRFYAQMRKERREHEVAFDPLLHSALKTRYRALELDHEAKIAALLQEREELHLNEEQRFIDRLTFRSGYMRDEEGGGRLAAEELRAQTSEFIKTYWDEPLPTNVVILACANLSGLSRACSRERRIETEDLRPFAGEFNAQHPWNTFVDVGPGKQRADKKIQGQPLSEIFTARYSLLTGHRDDDDLLG
ncbi:MAG: hypothetical protein Q9169_007958, partial [Polycauliona sp. 2 TL-2023]